MEYTFEQRGHKRVGLIIGVFEQIDGATRSGLREARSRCDVLVVGISATPSETLLARKRALEDCGYANSIFTYGNSFEYWQAVTDLGSHERLDHLIALEAA